MELISPNKLWETKVELSKKGLVRALLFIALMYYKKRVVISVHEYLWSRKQPSSSKPVFLCHWQSSCRLQEMPFIVFYLHWHSASYMVDIQCILIQWHKVKYVYPSILHTIINLQSVVSLFLGIRKIKAHEISKLQNKENLELINAINHEELSQNR